MKTVSQVRAVPYLKGHRIDLSWQNPPATDFQEASQVSGLQIVRHDRFFPRWPRLRSPNGESIQASDGTVIYDGAAPPLISQFSDQDLPALKAYYYTLFIFDAEGNYYADDQSRVAAFAGQDYRLTERLYKLLPAVHQRLDSSPESIAALPTQLRNRGQLWRFLYATAAPLDLMRSFAEGLPQLHDADRTPLNFLLPLARWIGWEPDRTLPTFAQRNEIRFAPHLYRRVGTVPGLRAIANQYTGWYTRVTEFEQQILRSNWPPQLNIFALVEGANSHPWQGADDAAPILGFGPENSTATGGLASPARLEGTVAEPFLLRSGMVVEITANSPIPGIVRLLPDDFVDMNQVTAAEVARVLNRTLPEITTTVVNESSDAGESTENRLCIQSNAIGPTSSLQINQQLASLVTLEGAPRGRLSTVKDQQERLRLFYETAEPSASDPELRQSRIRYKTFRQGHWGESYPLTRSSKVPQSDPSVVKLPDGRIWVGWIENPNTNASRLRYLIGATHPPQPARLVGQRTGPFRIRFGMRLLLRINRSQVRGVEFSAVDFHTNPNQLSLDEVVAVLNERLCQGGGLCRAEVHSESGTLVLETVALGEKARLEVDLHYSSAAQVLGFDHNNAIATGIWHDEIDWSEAEPQDVQDVEAGRHTDLHALVDSEETLRLFWATHELGVWKLRSIAWSDTLGWSTVQELAAEFGGNREPCAVLDDDHRIWLFWTHRQRAEAQRNYWNWILKYRIFNPNSASWGPPTALLPPSEDSQVADREPMAIKMPDNRLRLFFSSNRNGGTRLWSVTIDADSEEPQAVPEPVPISVGPALDRAPLPVLMANDALWLFFRSDRSVPLSHLATRSLPRVENRVTASMAQTFPFTPRPSPSFRLTDTGTLRRFAGFTSLPVKDVARLDRQFQWDDLLSYTPQKPREERLALEDRYTRGTVGLYLSPIGDRPLTRPQVERLRAILERFLPINVRVAIILSLPDVLEYVYKPGTAMDIKERYEDVYPAIEYYPSLDEYPGLADSSETTLPDWVLLLSNRADRVSADATDLTTLRNRTYFPPYLTPDP